MQCNEIHDITTAGHYFTRSCWETRHIAQQVGHLAYETALEQLQGVSQERKSFQCLKQEFEFIDG